MQVLSQLACQLTASRPRARFLSMGQLPELMTVPEVAEALRISDETVHRWCREGRLPFVRVLGLKRFRRDEIEALVTDREVAS